MALDVGIEIEFLAPGMADMRKAVARGFARDLTEVGVSCTFEGYTHQRTGSWKIVTDSSIHAPNGYVGLELVSPPLQDDGIPQIRLACNKLQSLGARTNRTCGLHVHVGARDKSIRALKRLAKLYLENEDIIDSLMPPSRRGNNNEYCRSLKTNAQLQEIDRATTIQELAAAVHSSTRSVFDTLHNEPAASRYTKLNLCAYWRHGTVEFRQHSGTVDPEKIIRWATFCQKMVDVADMESTAPIVGSLSRRSSAPSNPPRGRARRVIYEMALRPEGVTLSELQNRLGRQSRTSVSGVLGRLGFAVETNGRRDGERVYRIVPTTVEAAQTVATLQSMLAKLELEQDDIRFWQARHELLSRPRSDWILGRAPDPEGH